MRTKVLSPNQRIKIGEGYPTMLGDRMADMARVLTTVGLVLEIEHPANAKQGWCVLYAARRPITNNIGMPSAVPKAAARGESTE